MRVHVRLCESSVVSRTALVVDDHPGFRAVARALLESAGLEVVGEAGDGAAAITLCRTSDPDLVLLDVQLPDIDGFEVRRRLLRTTNPPAVLLTSTRAAAAFGPRLRGPEPIPFVSKDELSVAAVIAVLDPR
jgi:CheY-like chemotaxis protein